MRRRDQSDGARFWNEWNQISNDIDECNTDTAVLQQSQESITGR
jgi:hypothetical protein